MLRRFLALSVVLLFAGCSGVSDNSGGGGGNGGSHGTAANYPTLRSLAPSTTVVGSPSIALDVYGSNFADGAVVEWDGVDLATTWISATELNAAVPAADLASAGTVKVTAINGSVSDPLSNALTFTVVSPPMTGTTWVRAVPGLANPWDMVWDSVHDKFYASVGSVDPSLPNTIVSIDPVSGTTGTPVSVGDNPHLLALSSDASYLWVGLDGSNSVQRLLVPALAPDISLKLPQAASSLQAAPGSPHTIALMHGSGKGVYIYDDATIRPTSVAAWPSGPAIDWIQWGKDDTAIYGVGNFKGVFPLEVNSTGVSWNGTGGGVPLDFDTSSFDANNGLLYSVDEVLDPVHNTQTARYDVPLPDTACTVDNSLARYYCAMAFHASGADVADEELWVFDLNTYALLNRVKFGYEVGSAPSLNTSTVTGAPVKLLRWGKAGLALLTTSGAQEGAATSPYGPGGIFLINGAVVNPNVSPDVNSGSSPSFYSSLNSISPQGATAGSQDVTVSIIGKNFTQLSNAVCETCNTLQDQLPTSYVSSTQLNVTIPANVMTVPGPLAISIFDPSSGLYSNNALTFTVYPNSGSTQITALNLVGYAMAWDATHQLLYAGTADVDSAYPNSIVALSGQDGAIADVQSVSPDPNILSVGAGGQYLYATFAGTTTMSRFQLPSLGSPLSWSLNNSLSQGAFYAGDMKAAPVSPNTTAVTFFKPGSPEAVGGVGIFDDAALRPNVLPGWTMAGNSGELYETLAWGNSDSVLGSAENDCECMAPVYALAVNSSGASYLTSNGNFNDRYDEIHSDFGTGLVYSDDGKVANPVDATLVGSYGASGLVAPDSSLNRTFILGQTTAQQNSSSFTIQSFDERAFTPVSSIVVDNLLGTPIAFVRWGRTGLAILTLNESGNGTVEPFGMLYILQNSTFVSNDQPSSSDLYKKPELVQGRWKRISRADILQIVRTRRFLSGH